MNELVDLRVKYMELLAKYSVAKAMEETYKLHLDRALDEIDRLRGKPIKFDIKFNCPVCGVDMNSGRACARFDCPTVSKMNLKS